MTYKYGHPPLLAKRNNILRLHRCARDVPSNQFELLCYRINLTEYELYDILPLGDGIFGPLHGSLFISAIKYLAVTGMSRTLLSI